MTNLLLLGAFPFLMAVAAAMDFVSMTIPNRVSLALIVLFFGVAVLLRMPLAQVLLHVLAFAVVLTVTFGCFVRGWIGGGDAKLAASTALWFGFSAQLYNYVLFSALLGGALTLLLLYARTYALPRVLAGQAWAVRLHDERQGIPYGIALAAAGLLVYADTPIFKAAFH